MDCRKKEVGVKFGTQPVQAVLPQPLGDERARGGIPEIYTPLYALLAGIHTHTYSLSVSVSVFLS